MLTVYHTHLGLVRLNRGYNLYIYIYSTNLFTILSVTSGVLGGECGQ